MGWRCDSTLRNGHCSSANAKELGGTATEYYIFDEKIISPKKDQKLTIHREWDCAGRSNSKWKDLDGGIIMVRNLSMSMAHLIVITFL